jgi:hypothetical protein
MNLVAARAAQPDFLGRNFDFAKKEFLVWEKEFSAYMLRPNDPGRKSAQPRFSAHQ